MEISENQTRKEETMRTNPHSNIFATTFNAAGFTPPDQMPWTKQDPRGPEYGTYYASPAPTEARPTAIRVVYKNARGQNEWYCTFDDSVSFGMWARQVG